MGYRIEIRHDNAGSTLTLDSGDGSTAIRRYASSQDAERAAEAARQIVEALASDALPCVAPLVAALRAVCDTLPLPSREARQLPLGPTVH